ncbi:MAG TPA: bifunctional UDP-N-acetylglucosamine diphosphorylase/glucosamine-1-phosphate N-acetyltransferase GlmU [Steroidobacteraceae bacterium]|jgi:bifunctional UDP-N-acetylglucosamine pyrophosphorylase/glucosamine-1-phosphate N-acetyltransferase|nr:bifunctional UDP-N-acetylglucosamine diphosphorylase/glucosamine-1-phosphate N-acetyltransferase GlmU [Steroidobacteraceae bacterium]
MQLSVVILAAGQGKRMNSDLPKVLQPLAGRPLLKHVIDTARKLGPAEVYVVYGHGGAQVQAAMADEPVDWILQADQLGTGHAVMQAMCVIPDDHVVLVLYGDVPLIRATSLERLLAAAKEGALAVLTVTLEQPLGYGRIVRTPSGHVSAIVEQKDATSDERAIREVNSGLMAAPAGRLRDWLLGLGRNNSQREYYLTDVVAGAVQAGNRVDAVEIPDADEVAGVNDKIQLARVEAIHRRMRAEELMFAGATLADPARIDVRGEVEVGRDVFIDVNVVLSGKVQLAAGVAIGPQCVITDSRIGAGTVVKAGSVIDRAVTGSNCRIGPFAHIRPDSVLANDVHVGNFVEIKASEIGERSKANHLTYVGDSRIGENVNVGAGTITCNYDGLNKWPTVIEDGAFIGSGSMLVAPVRIGAGATVGAGSTITETAPAGELTLTRARQTTIEGWKRPPKFSDADKQAIIEAKLAGGARGGGNRGDGGGGRGGGGGDRGGSEGDGGRLSKGSSRSRKTATAAGNAVKGTVKRTQQPRATKKPRKTNKRGR